MAEFITFVNTLLLAGVFLTGVFWVVRTVRKDRKDEHDKNEPRPAS